MAAAERGPQCCCGQPDCAFLEHTCRTLQGLERDVKTAAELGQALLVRHEAYMAEAEAERKWMTASIERLELEKQELEADNARKVEENRYLLDQLESVNQSVGQADERVRSLESALQRTQDEIHRLTVLASRAEALECQLLQLETQQVNLQHSLDLSVEDERSAVQRWRQAERTIASLQDQIERIEKEARADRERHVEVVQRMQRRKAVEMELQAAAGRLKGAAASKTVGGPGGGSSVVSHFVKDILQDNANLQQAVVELRDLLLGSNEEVESLRQQLMLHSPVEQDADGEVKPNLKKELEMEASRTSEVHVHHHYHAPPTEAKAKNVVQHRRSKKRRSVMMSPSLPPSAYHSARSSISSVRGEPSSAAAILANTAVSIPTRHRTQWSMQSGISVASSVPSSPPFSDYRRTSSIFDRVFSDAGMDSSRPTSPESDYAESPKLGPTQRVGLPFVPVRSRSTPPTRALKSPVFGSLAPSGTSIIFAHEDVLEVDVDVSNLTSIKSPAILEEPEEPEEPEQIETQSMSSNFESPDSFPASSTARRLRRANSHDSLLSISGMDIHTLKSRPSQLLRAETAFNSQPVLSATTTMALAARPNLIQHNDSDSLNTLKGSLLNGNAANQRVEIGRSRWAWSWNIWGSSPAEPSRVLETQHTPRSNENATPPATRMSPGPKVTPTPRKMRQPGINQPGAIWGMRPEPVTPHSTRVVSLDEEALREGLFG